MNKAQFVDALTQRLDADKKQAAAALDAVIDTVYAAVSKGEKITLTGFGVFEKRERAARTARNPATGATVKVKKTSVPAFRAGAEFKAITSGAKKLAKLPAKKATAATGSTRKTVASKVAPAKTAVSSVRKTVAKAAPAAKAVAAKTAPAKKAVASRATATKAAVKKATPAKRSSAKAK